MESTKEMGASTGILIQNLGTFRIGVVIARTPTDTQVLGLPTNNGLTIYDPLVIKKVVKELALTEATVAQVAGGLVPPVKKVTIDPRAVCFGLTVTLEWVGADNEPSSFDVRFWVDPSGQEHCEDDRAIKVDNVVFRLLNCAWPTLTMHGKWEPGVPLFQVTQTCGRSFEAKETR